MTEKLILINPVVRERRGQALGIAQMLELK
jgi:hypothetical protein